MTLEEAKDWLNKSDDYAWPVVKEEIERLETENKRLDDLCKAKQDHINLFLEALEELKGK